MPKRPSDAFRITTSYIRKKLRNAPRVVGTALVNDTRKRLSQGRGADGQPLQKRKFDFRPGGQVLYRRGNLARSVRYDVLGQGKLRILAGDDQKVQYAKIHNEGGSIAVTPKMKRYHWAMERKSRGAKKSFHKAMALKKVGSKIKMPKRTYLAITPHTRQIVQRELNEYLQRSEL